MKKAIIVLFILSLGVIFGNKNENEIIIPDSAIRFRVIANSNTLEDQTQKLVIKDKVEKEVYELIGHTKNENEVRNIIQNNMGKIDEIVAKYDIDYNIDYGYNYFPSKSYKGVVYGAGNYESLVITLGSGMGENFWCVLFPPLCMMDASSEGLSDVEYKSYVKELLDKF